MPVIVYHLIREDEPPILIGVCPGDQNSIDAYLEKIKAVAKAAGWDMCDVRGTHCYQNAIKVGTQL